MIYEQVKFLGEQSLLRDIFVFFQILVEHPEKDDEDRVYGGGQPGYFGTEEMEEGDQDGGEGKKVVPYGAPVPHQHHAGEGNGMNQEQAEEQQQNDSTGPVLVRDVLVYDGTDPL